MAINLSYEKYSKWVSGRKTVTTAGTAVPLASASTRGTRVVVQAETDNTGNIAVGDANVVAAAGSEEGNVLIPGASIDVHLSDLAEIYIDSTVNGEGVTYNYYSQG